jgi:hypothetical protein
MVKNNDNTKNTQKTKTPKKYKQSVGKSKRPKKKNSEKTQTVPPINKYKQGGGGLH